MRFATPWRQGNFARVSETIEVASGFHLILLKGPWGVDLDVMEISLAIDTPQGTVLIVGCSHPTIEKIVEAAKQTINKPIHLVISGTHLLPAKDEDIKRVAAALRDAWKVAWLAPVHCAGKPAFAILKETLGDRYVYAGLGTTISIGPTLKAVAEVGQPQMHAMNEVDLRRYRALLEQSEAHAGVTRYAHGESVQQALLSNHQC